MKMNRRSFVVFGAVASTAFLACLAPRSAPAADAKSSAAGVWTWTVPGRNGGPDRTNTLHLKIEGEKLTGKLVSPGRDNQPTETAISDGKASGEAVEFKVERVNNDRKVIVAYRGVGLCGSSEKRPRRVRASDSWLREGIE